MDHAALRSQPVSVRRPRGADLRSATPSRTASLTREQELDYQMQLSFRGDRPETLEVICFACSTASVTIAFSLCRRSIWRCHSSSRSPGPAVRLGDRLWPLVFALGVNFFPAFQYHYMAGVACLFVLIAVTGLQQLAA